MATKTTLKMMKCPTCGASLKAENEKDVIVCVYCGNSIVPVVETVAPVDKNTDGGFGGVLRVEGIKTSSSAVAYMEQFFEEYDWDSFVYAQNLSCALRTRMPERSQRKSLLTICAEWQRFRDNTIISTPAATWDRALRPA